MATSTFRSGVFISYSHADKAWLTRLQVQLAPYTRGEQIQVWDDTKLSPGADWSMELQSALDSARVAVLLVSADYLASDYVQRVELREILRRARTDLTVLWVLIRPALYEATPLMAIQAAYDPAKPLSTLPKPQQEAALAGISRHVAAAMNVNVVANALRIIDDFEPEAKAFVAGVPEPEVQVSHSTRAEQVEASINLIDPSGSRKLIVAADLERLDADTQKLVRAYERTMKVLFERWTELKPKRYAQDPQIQAEARSESDEVRGELCRELNGLLGFIESMGMSLQDHYYHVRYVCTQAAV